MTNKTPRGIRNNNPGNIRNSERIEWKGEVAKADKNDQAFEEFEDMPHGVRAMMLLLRNYQKKYGLKSVRDLVSRYAPHFENDTNAYVRTVCGEIGVPSDAPVDLKDKGLMCAMVDAMTRVENGQRIAMSDIEAGWNLL